MADYIGASRARVIAGDITLTDGGGDFTLTGVVSFGPCAVTWIATFADLAPSGRKCTLRLIAQAGRGGSDFQTINTVVNNPSPLTGTFSISIETREIVQVGSIPSVMSGPIVIDPGMTWGARSREYQYGDADVTISLLGQTATKTQNTGTEKIEPRWTLRADTDLLGSNSSGGNAVSATTLPTSAATSAPSETITKSGSYSSGGFSYNYDCTATADSSSASSSADADSTFAVTGIFARATSIVSPDRDATLYGRLQRMVATWPDPIQYRVSDGGAYTLDSDGTFSAGISQKQYDVRVSVFDHLSTPFGSSGVTSVARERANILPSVENIGGLRIYGPRWDAISLAWTSAQTIDDGTSLSPTGTWAGDWTGAGGASLSIASGAVQVTGSAGKSVSRSFSTSWQAYSRLRIRLACSAAAHDITLRLGADTTVAGITYKAKEWTLTTGTGGAGSASAALYEFASPPQTGTGANSTISFGVLLTLTADITVTHLGAFDSTGDGVTSREVRLYDGSTGSTLLETVTFSSDGTLENAFRYKALGSPRTLTAGTYRLTVAVGSFTDRFWAPSDGGTLLTETFGGALSITGFVTGASGGAPDTPSAGALVVASLKADYDLPETNDLFVDLGAETSGPDYSVWDFGNQVPTPQPGGSYKNAYFGGGGALTLEDLGAGTYDIEEIELLTAPDGSGGHNAPLIHAFRDYLISQVDGILGFRYASQLSSGTIADLVSAINAGGPQGYSATDLSPAVSGAEPWPLSELQTSRHTNVAIGGYGLLFAMSGTSPAWTIGFDTSAFAIGALPAQWAVSEIAWDWPESDVAGFLWDDGAGGKAIGAGLSLGSSLWGRVLQVSDTQTAGDDTAPAGRDPSAGTGVTLKSLSGVTLATETTEADGTFYFPALASIEGSVRMLVDGQDGWIEVPFSAARSRVVVVEVAPGVPGTLLAMAVSVTGRVVRAYRDTSDDIVLEFWRRSGWDAVTTSLSATGGGAMACDKQDANGRLWLVLEESGGIKSRYTDDEGGTWSVATTIASSGNDPAIWPSPTGLLHYFWRDGAAIKTTVLDSQGNIPVATTTVVASGVADSPIDALYDGSLWHLTYRNTSNAVITVVSSDGGLTFS